MAEQKQTPNLSDLTPEIQKPLTIFAEKLTTILADNLVSLTVVGSSITADYQPGKSDINTVLVVNKQSPTLLDELAKMGKAMGKKRLRAPILMTPAYIAQSLDVFGIEFLDFQLIHKTILGQDPFEKLQIKKTDVRLQAERELKAALIRLRQGFIAAIENRDKLSQLLGSAATNLLPVLRAMLWLVEKNRPDDTENAIKACTEAFEVDCGAITSAKKLRRIAKPPPMPDIKKLFESVYTCVEKLAELVDKLEV